MSGEPHGVRRDPLFDIRGKVALVTGGARGIGAFISEGLVRAGVGVLVASRDAEAAETFAAGMAGLGDCTGVYSDLLAPDGAQRLADAVLEQSPRLDILVNNSGVTSRAPLESFTEQDLDSVMDLNVKAAFFLTAVLAPLLREAATASDPSRVVNISSMPPSAPMTIMPMPKWPARQRSII